MFKNFGRTAVLLFCAYMIGFGIVLIVHPSTVSGFGLVMANAAGITEVRVFYGGISLAVGVFFLLLVRKGLIIDCLTGATLIATTVIILRLCGTTYDGGWFLDYTKLAIPCELFFAASLGTTLFFEKRKLKK